MKQLLCSAGWALIGWVLAILSMTTVNWCGHGYGEREYNTMGAIVWNKYGLPAFHKQLKPDKDEFVSKSAKGGKNALLTWPPLKQTMSEPATSDSLKATDKLIEKFFVVNLGAFDGSHSSTMSDEARERLAEMPFDKFFHDKLRMPVLAVAREADLRDQVSHAKLVNVDEANKKVVARAWKDLKGARLIEVEHHFLSFYGLLTAPIPLKMVRWCNGWIQFLTLWSFWVAVLLVVRNWICNSLLLRREVRSLANEIPIVSAIGTALTEENIQNLLDKFAKRGNSFPVRVYRSVFQSYLAGQLRSWNLPTDREKAPCHDLLDKLVQNRLKTLESDQAPIIYLAWSMPSLGFIGTVLGIGNALLAADRMMTPDTNLQKEAIQSIVLDLGMAFDTTFVALMLSLVLMALIYLGRRAEEAVPLRLQADIMETVISRLC